MKSKEEIVSKIFREYDMKRTVAERKRQKYVEKVHEECPRLEEITNEINSIGFGMISKIMANPEKSEEIRKEDLLYGTLPVKENEVLVTEDYAEENEIKKEDLGVKQYSFYDIYKEKYNGYYDCYMNLYDYYKDGVIITGVVKNSMESEGEVFASHKKWETIKKEYCFYNGGVWLHD